MSSLNPTTWPDLTQWAPIPGKVGFLLHRDGRVMSLRTPGGPKVLAENPATSLAGRTVTISGVRFRVRDLVGIIWGSTIALDERTEDEYERLYQERLTRHREAF